MTKKLFVLLTLQLVTIEVVRVAAISLTIRPEHVYVDQDTPQSVNFTCAADVALAGCQFRWLDDDNKPGPLLELSRGSQSRADPAHLDTKMTGYSYSGRGLGAGDCGVSLQVKGDKEWMVACRVRAEYGGWTYAWANLFADAVSFLPHNMATPREVVVLPGAEARFSLEAGEPLDECYFYPPPSYGRLDFSQGPESRYSTGRHTYVGAGLKRGQCGLAVINVSEADNGPVRCFIGTPAFMWDLRFMALVVARPPTAPTLSLTYTGTNVTATCAVQESRPVAKISWVLGDVIIRQDENDDTQADPQDEWTWPWMQGSIQQTLTLQLQPQYNGKDLKCRVSHIALAQPLEAKSTVSFVEPTMSTTPVTTTSTTPMATPDITTSTTPGKKCLADNILDLLCQENRLQPTQLANISCPNDEVYAFHIREAGAVARTAEVLEEVAKVSLEAALVHARAEEAWAKNAEEELQYERKRRART